MAGADNARTKRGTAVEILALQVFNAADRDGVDVTRQMTQELLDGLAGHPDTCRCGLCALVELAAPNRVFWQASRWQVSIARTRDRATR